MSGTREALLACASAFGKRLTEESVAVWLEDLDEYPADVVVEAFRIARRTFGRFPTISGLIELCGAETADRRRRDESREWKPPLEYSIEEKRRFVEYAASGERRTFVPSAIVGRGRSEWDQSVANAQRLLDTMTDEDFERATMPGLLLKIQPGWDSRVGRMP